MMKNYTIYVTENIARIVQEKGFECFAIGKHPDVEDYGKIFNSEPDYLKPFYWYLPTAEEICGWLREEKSIDIYLHNINKTGHYKCYGEFLNIPSQNFSLIEPSYKEALLKGIERTLESI